MTFLVRDNFDSENAKDIAQCENTNPRIGKVRLLQTALVLLSSFFVAELIAALNSHSLSLLADAGHVFSDVAALAITLTATWYSSLKRKSKSVDCAIELSSGTILKNRQDACSTNSEFDCGVGILPARKKLVLRSGSILKNRQDACSTNSEFDCGVGILPARGEIIAALINSISLVAIALWIAAESIGRLQSPTPEVEGLPMLITAIVGLSINSINACCLHSCCHGDLNLKSAFLHAVADIFSSVGVILAAIAVAWLHWNWADGLISLLVSASIILLTLPLLIESLQLLLGKVSAISATQPPCDCEKLSAEKLLFPSLEELIK
ncbi:MULTISPECIES: cation diffusion facilitator family transporter [unclassified Microcoleus]|uniref:cation diffusion facilitator family transporter n=1 Tax=unclassified Microcoleus TaxID=2642155 RepID=UPI002FD3E368